ncbi:chaperonin 10-like protein [Xylogone sp. PMI_703]|nr:chaperonin 10-like protein [Xylogone sp. PMI_703]
MSNHAVVIVDKGKAEIQEVPPPTLGDEFILVKTHAVALNPTDWKHIDRLPSPGARVGCDYAGTVLEVGSKVTKDFKKGDRVAGVTHGSNAVGHEDGCFQEIIRARGDLQIKIPDNLSFEEASTLGVGITTVGQSLYQSLELPLPGSGTTKDDYLLIYGGSTATGALAIQFAKLSGLHVIVTCSAHNFDYVKSVGADAAFDYKSPTCSKDIKDYTKDSLKYALDCISEGDSTQITVEAMSSSGGVYTNLLSVADEQVHSVNPKVQKKGTLAYTMFGQPFKMGDSEIPTVPGHWEFGVMFWELSRKLLAGGKVKVHKPTVNKGGSGLEGVMAGLDLLRNGKVSGEKLVYTL